MNTPDELQIELTSKGATFNPLELSLPENMTLADWAAVGRKLCRSDQVLKWWLGDWAAFGVRRYGQLKEFANANGIAYQTLADLAWVSKAIELSRRRESLEWSKHKEVAALEPKEQSKWLEKVEKESLPVAELRRQIRKSQGTSDASKPDGPVIRFVSKALDELRAFLSNRPEDFWTPEIRSIWKDRLKWLVDFHAKL